MIWGKEMALYFIKILCIIKVNFLKENHKEKECYIIVLVILFLKVDNGSKVS
jgi:hypothetical protein